MEYVGGEPLDQRYLCATEKEISEKGNTEGKNAKASARRRNAHGREEAIEDDTNANKRERRRITEDECGSLCRSVLEGLSVIHNEDIVHGSLSPSSIVIDALVRKSIEWTIIRCQSWRVNG